MSESQTARKGRSSPPKAHGRLSPLTVWIGAILAAALALSPIPSTAGRRGGGGNKGNRRGGPKPPKKNPRRGPNPKPRGPRGPQKDRGNRSRVNPRTGQTRGTRGGQPRGGRRGTAWGNREADRDLYRTWGLFLPDLGNRFHIVFGRLRRMVPTRTSMWLGFVRFS